MRIVQRVVVLAVLAATSLHAGAQGPGMSASTNTRDPVFYRGECVGTNGARNEEYDPCPRVPNYKCDWSKLNECMTRDRIVKLSRHPIEPWNTGSDPSNDVVKDQWPSASRIAGWPASYPVVLLYAQKQPEDKAKPSPPGKDGKDGKNGRDGQDGKPGKNGSPGRDGKDGRDGRDGKDGKDGKEGPPGKDRVEVKEVPVEVRVPGPETLAFGGAGAAGGYMLARLLRRRRRDDDDEEEDEVPRGGSPAPTLNARVHPDRIGEQEVYEFEAREAQFNEHAGRGDPSIAQLLHVDRLGAGLFREQTEVALKPFYEEALALKPGLGRAEFYDCIRRALPAALDVSLAEVVAGGWRRNSIVPRGMLIQSTHRSIIDVRAGARLLACIVVRSEVTLALAPLMFEPTFNSIKTDGDAYAGAVLYCADARVLGEGIRPVAVPLHIALAPA